MIAELGKNYQLTKEDCSYLNIKCIYDLYSTTKDVENNMKASIKNGKQQYAVTKTITLPPLIVDDRDIWEFYYPDTEPNYITLQSAHGNVIIMESITSDMNYEGKILLIPSADPGYDWIFSKGIKGFITKYGGANSHMAIRAGELGIPAVVGVGAKQYEILKKADVLEIDSLSKNIRILKYK